MYVLSQCNQKIAVSTRGAQIGASSISLEEVLNIQADRNGVKVGYFLEVERLYNNLIKSY